MSLKITTEINLLLCEDNALQSKIIRLIKTNITKTDISSADLINYYGILRSLEIKNSSSKKKKQVQILLKKIETKIRSI